MKKLIILLAACFIMSEGAQAQSMGRTYKTALGVKVWDGAGITFKTFINSRDAVEVIGYFYKNGSRVTGLYEIHGAINGAPGLKWYVGPGAHVGFYNLDKNRRFPGSSYTVVGIDGVLGLDYKINRAPLNLSIDWQPSFEFGDFGGFVGSWGGLAIRYAF